MHHNAKLISLNMLGLLFKSKSTLFLTWGNILPHLTPIKIYVVKLSGVINIERWCGSGRQLKADQWKVPPGFIPEVYLPHILTATVTHGLIEQTCVYTSHYQCRTVKVKFLRKATYQEMIKVTTNNSVLKLSNHMMTFNPVSFCFITC